MSTMDLTASARPTLSLPAPLPLARVVALVAGMALWALAVSRVDLNSVRLFGLLPSLGVAFYAAMGLLVVGVLSELATDRPRTWLLLAYVGGLIVAVHGTIPAIVHDVPEYPWVYKHLGEAAALQSNGGVVNPDDIYQQWPALFAAVAAISQLSGVPAVDFAAWAPLAFELAGGLLLLGVLRQLTEDRRLPYLAVLIWIGLSAWVKQDYLSPQAFGYLLWLGVILIALRWLGPQARPGQPRRSVAIALVVVLFATIVFAHQLSPFAALAGLGALAVTRQLRPWWLVLALGAVAGAFLASRYQLISSQYGGLVSGVDPTGNATGVATTWHSTAEAFTARVVRFASAGMWLAAAIVVLHRRRQVLVPGVLAFAPFAVLLGQSYGGEAIYRVFLFSAPWCAYLIAVELSAVRWSRVRAVAGLVLVGVALAAGMQGLYGPTAVLAMRPGELSASDWFYAHAERGSTLVLPAGNFPAGHTADFADYHVEIMPSDPLQGHDWLDLADLKAVDHYVDSFGPKPVYLTVSRTMYLYADYYGNPASLGTLSSELAHSSHWAVAYRNADATVYRYQP